MSLRWGRRPLPDDFPPHLVRAALDLLPFGFDEWAWPYPEILEVIEELAARSYAILGGDVWRKGERGMGSLGDNWYLDPDASMSWSTYVRESANASLKYIQRYHDRNEDGYWFVPVFKPEEEDTSESSSPL
jgi:hypothetical protein